MTLQHRIKLLRQLNKEYLDIIRKQHLIIESAGIVYPTIYQSLGHIQDIYLASKGRTHELANAEILPVEIKVI